MDTVSNWNMVPVTWKSYEDDDRLVYLNCGKSCNCTLIKYKAYKNKPFYGSYSPRHKAGIIMTTKDNKFLIIQSRGRLWGMPKGGIEMGETPEQCALREFVEETGIQTNTNNFTFFREIYVNRSKYFCIKNQPQHKVSLTDEHDSTGVGWISRNCMDDFVKHKLIKFTSDFNKIMSVI